ncbi:MAG: hypothetical protein HQK54_08520 [Oligoflexales bacterium]|nr:hypothetical protein [Oligoflexales bacterium]
MKFLPLKKTAPFFAAALLIFAGCGKNQNKSEDNSESGQNANQPNQADATENTATPTPPPSEGTSNTGGTDSTAGSTRSSDTTTSDNKENKDIKLPVDDSLVKGLSDAAKAALQKVAEILNALLAEKQKICPYDNTLYDKMLAEIKAVRENSSLSETEKYKKIREIYTSHQVQLEAEQKKFITCLSTNSAAIRAIAEKEYRIMEACLIPFSYEPNETTAIGLNELDADIAFTGNTEMPCIKGDAGTAMMTANLEKNLQSSECSAATEGK